MEQAPRRPSGRLPTLSSTFDGTPIQLYHRQESTYSQRTYIIVTSASNRCSLSAELKSGSFAEQTTRAAPDQAGGLEQHEQTAEDELACKKREVALIPCTR